MKKHIKSELTYDSIISSTSKSTTENFKSNQHDHRNNNNYYYLNENVIFA